MVKDSRVGIWERDTPISKALFHSCFFVFSSHAFSTQTLPGVSLAFTITSTRQPTPPFFSFPNKPTRKHPKRWESCRFERSKSREKGHAIWDNYVISIEWEWDFLSFLTFPFHLIFSSGPRQISVRRVLFLHCPSRKTQLLVYLYIAFISKFLYF